MKYNKYIFATLLVFGVFTILQHLKTDILYLMTYGTTAIFIWLFSISDIKTKTVSALWIYIAMVIVFLLRFCMMCSLAVNRVPAFMIESIIIFIVLNILSKALKNRIGSGDFDFFARLRVFAFSCFSFTRFKSSEADKLNLVVLLYGILYSVNKCVQCALGVLF